MLGRTIALVAAALVSLAALSGIVDTGRTALPAPSLYVSAEGADSGNCRQGAPCRTFDRAFDLAAPGQVIEVAGGTYPGQKLTGGQSRTTPVTFRPAAGAVVRLADETEVLGSNLSFVGTGLDTGFIFESWTVEVGAKNVTFEAVNTGIFSIHGASNVTIRSGQVGPWPHGSDSGVTSSKGIPPTNILIDGVYFHDVQRASPDDHTECLQFGAGQNVVIRNSRFHRCSDHDIFIRSWGGPADKLANFTIENNFFGKTTLGFYTGQFSRPSGSGGTCENFVLRNNIFEQAWTIRCAPSNDSPSAIRVTGNYWAFPGVPQACGTGVWQSNLYQQASRSSCDASPKVVSARVLGVSLGEALTRLRKIGFRCGTPIASDLHRVTTCGSGGRRFNHRVVVVASPSDSVNLISATSVKRSGTALDAATMLSPLAAMPFAGRATLAARANRFVSKWIGRSADARIGGARLRVFVDDEALRLLISAA